MIGIWVGSPLTTLIRSAATHALVLLSQMICNQALSALRPMTSTWRFGARAPTGLLFVLGALRTFGEPVRAMASQRAAGVPVPVPGDGRGPAVASEPTCTAPLAGATPTLGVATLELPTPSELLMESSGLPLPGFGSTVSITRNTITVPTMPRRIAR